MGCVCTKGRATGQSKENPEERLSSIKLAKSWSERTVSLRRVENYTLKDLLDDCSNEKRSSLQNRQIAGSVKLKRGSFLKKREMVEGAPDHPGVGMVPGAVEGELVAAGWPSWLTAVAGEAIVGWVPRAANSFEKLDKIGQGTYSRVYRARDLTDGKLVALKEVRFDNHDPESVRFMAREILILRRLDHPNIIKLEGLITSRVSCSLYLIFQYMEHDLTGLASHPGQTFTEPQIKCYMKQLLLGLDHCHTHGVLHRDIKGSNLLIDNNGILKIADFGLASCYEPHQSHPLTSRVVTLWYRPPELLLGATHYGSAVDLWSTGCIVAELYAGKPIMPGRTEVEQIHKIFKLCGSPSEGYWRTLKLPRATIFKPQQHYMRCVAETFKSFPSPALALIERLLSIDPADRGSAVSALTSEFFTTRPLPCDPSSLPKYPPSKEFDAKLRDEAKRQVSGESKGQNREYGKRGSREPRAALAPGTDTESISSMQRRRGYINSKSRSGKLISHPEQVISGFPMYPASRSPSSVHEAINDHQRNMPKRISHSGPLVNPAAWAKAGKNIKDARRRMAMDNLPGMLSDSVAPRSTLLEDCTETSLRQVSKPITRFVGAPKSMARQEQNNHGTVDRQHCADKRSNNIPIHVSYESKVKQIPYSGPLLAPSSKVDQMLKHHDLRIQEAVRRARLERVKLRNMLVDENQVARNSLLVSGG